VGNPCKLGNDNDEYEFAFGSMAPKSDEWEPILEWPGPWLGRGASCSAAGGWELDLVGEEAAASCCTERWGQGPASPRELEAGDPCGASPGHILDCCLGEPVAVREDPGCCCCCCCEVELAAVAWASSVGHILLREALAEGRERPEEEGCDSSEGVSLVVSCIEAAEPGLDFAFGRGPSTAPGRGGTNCSPSSWGGAWPICQPARCVVWRGGGGGCRQPA